MNIVNSDTSDTPIYQQIFEQIRAQIIRGELPSGAPLPPIRTISKELRVSVITVKKAWELLEGLGLIVTACRARHRRVRYNRRASWKKPEPGILNNDLAQDIHRYQELGFTQTEIIESIKKTLQDET